MRGEIASARRLPALCDQDHEFGSGAQIQKEAGGFVARGVLSSAPASHVARSRFSCYRSSLGAFPSLPRVPVTTESRNRQCASWVFQSRIPPRTIGRFLSISRFLSMSEEAKAQTVKTATSKDTAIVTTDQPRGFKLLLLLLLLLPLSLEEDPNPEWTITHISHTTP